MLRAIAFVGAVLFLTCQPSHSATLPPGTLRVEPGDVWKITGLSWFLHIEIYDDAGNSCAVNCGFRVDALIQEYLLDSNWQPTYEFGPPIEVVGFSPLHCDGSICELVFSGGSGYGSRGLWVKLSDFQGPMNLIVGPGDYLEKLSPVPHVPLPASLPLFATGLGALVLIAWRKRRRCYAGQSPVCAV
jgi:hypothetical protein